MNTGESISVVRLAGSNSIASLVSLATGSAVPCFHPAGICKLAM